MKNKWIFGLVAAALSSLSLVEAQAPPPTAAPPPDAGPMSRVSGSVSQFNYDPEGRIEGFLLTPRTLVFLPPEEAMQAEASIKRGERIDVTGSLQSSPNGMQIMDAETIRVGGKMISGAEELQPAPYSGKGSVAQLNYGRGGEVNGFVLSNGVIAHLPPEGDNGGVSIRPGATLSFSGLAHVTATGKTVVDVQSITADGRTISLNDAGPGRGPDARTPLPPAPAPSRQ